MSHIHGLGLDPADDAVVIATHTGLFRAGPGETEAERVGDSRQDTMGFTVIAPRTYLGSGHPDAREELPPLLGLVRSDDAGLSWEPVSLLGEADFHVLRAAGERVYGVDSVSGELLASSDGGRTWKRRAQPAPVIDLAIDPEAPEHLVASTERGVYGSSDAGRTWRPLTTRMAGLLAWDERLVLVDGTGRVHASRDAGRTFAAVGALAGPPVALSARDGILLAAFEDNTVHSSDDGGRSWRLRVRPDDR